MVLAYWNIGKQIVKAQDNDKRAEYGSNLINYLSEKLTREFGKGFTSSNLKYMRQFYLTFPNSHTLCDQLSWSHYRLLIKVADTQKRGQMDFYIRYFEKKIKTETDNPTLGIVLCSEKNDAMVKYTILNENKQLFASKYKLYIPTEEELKQELLRERRLIEQALENKHEQ